MASFFSTIFVDKKIYYYFGDKMKVKIFDAEDEGDLEGDINSFIECNNIEVIDIKYQVGISIFADEQIYCFSAMIIYTTVE